MGQEVTAGIVGTVTDPSGAPINGAAVTARDTERGTVWTATTSDAGAYNITRLPVGTYEVKVAAPGFQTAIHPPFILVLNQTARVDVQMKVGKRQRDGRSDRRGAGPADAVHRSQHAHRCQHQRQPAAGFAQLPSTHAACPRCHQR